MPMSIKYHNLHSFKEVVILLRPLNETNITFIWLSSLYSSFKDIIGSDLETFHIL